MVRKVFYTLGFAVIIGSALLTMGVGRNFQATGIMCRSAAVYALKRDFGRHGEDINGLLRGLINDKPWFCRDATRASFLWIPKSNVSFDGFKPPWIVEVLLSGGKWLVFIEYSDALTSLCRSYYKLKACDGRVVRASPLGSVTDFDKINAPRNWSTLFTKVELAKI